MAKGKVQHWKHGWIPLDAYARDIVSRRGKKEGTRPSTATAVRPSKRYQDWLAKQAQQADLDQDVKSRQVGGYRITSVDGYPDVTFKEVMEVDRRPPEQYREVAKVVTDALKPYPGAIANSPIEIGWSDELETSVMADTTTQRNHKIRLQPNMWDKPNMTTAQMHEMAKRHFGLTAQATSLEEFRRNVIIHELGHVLNMKEQDRHRQNDGPLDQIAFENVTPAELGYTRVAEKDLPIGEDPPPGKTLLRLDRPQRRWRIDSLNGQSAYATSNPYEFLAEAFLDGTINGDKASESGKRVVARAQMEFGPGMGSK